MDDRNNIFDISEARRRVQTPDPETTHYDQYGRPMFTYVGEYQNGGKIETIDIIAYDMADAEKKIANIRQSLTYSGLLISRIPAD